jgi:plasmid maintenance system antidote protein VapI
LQPSSKFLANTFTIFLRNENPFLLAVAVGLGKLFGDGAGVWVRMQSAYDTWHPERELANEIKKIPTLKPAAA